MKKKITEFRDNICKAWKNLRRVQRISLILILTIAFACVVFLCSMGSTSFMTPLFTSHIADNALVDRISFRLDQEGVAHKVSDGMIYLSNKADAQKMITLLVREDLVPKSASPWEVFKMDRWTTTDFERNVNLRRAISTSLEEHIQALADIDRARITLVMPEKALFAEDQKEVSASIIITPHPGSDITTNPKKIQGIIKLVKFAVEGLEDKNITISDTDGNVLTDADCTEQNYLKQVVTPVEEVPAEKGFFDMLPVNRNVAYAAIVALTVMILVVLSILILGKKRKDVLLDEARNMASQNPEEVARLIKSWLSEDS